MEPQPTSPRCLANGEMRPARFYGRRWIPKQNAVALNVRRVSAIPFLFAVVCLAGPLFAADKELKSVGLTVGDLGNPFFVQIAHGAAAQARTYNPDVKFTSLSGNYSVKTQIEQMNSFVTSGVDLIVLGAVNSKGIAPAVKRARAAGITVVAVDVGAEGGVSATVMSDNRQAGEEAGQYISDKLKGKGQIVIVNGPAVTSVQDRVAGALSVFKKYPGINILSQDKDALGTKEGGLRVMTDLQTAYQHLDAVFAINDPTSLGCDLAAKQAGRSDYFIVGVDGSPAAVAAIKSKQGVLDATAAQDPYAMAEKAVEVGYDIMQGKKPEKDTILIPVKLVTRANVDEYTGWTR